VTMIAPDARHPPIERVVEQAIFADRWFLAPIYIGLAAGLLALLVKGDAVAAADGVNFQRLQETKAKYDPENFFHMNHNISRSPRGHRI
jgi:hypothetical protein